MKNIIFDIGGVIFLEKSNSVLNKFNIKEEDIKELSIFFENTEKLDKGLQTVEERFEFSIEVSVSMSGTMYSKLQGNPGKSLFSFDGEEWNKLSSESVIFLLFKPW